jgi:integrase
MLRSATCRSPLPTAVLLPRVVVTALRALGFGTLVRLAAYTGLRWSELAGLRIKDVDFSRRRLTVTHAVVEVRGTLIEGSRRATKPEACRSHDPFSTSFKSV